MDPIQEGINFVLQEEQAYLIELEQQDAIDYIVLIN